MGAAFGTFTALEKSAGEEGKKGVQRRLVLDTYPV